MVDRILRQEREGVDVRKYDSLENESVILKDDLKEYHSSYDSIVTDLAIMVKGRLSSVIKKINSEEFKEVNNEATELFEEMNSKILDLEETQKDLDNLVSYISGLDRSIRTPSILFKILDEEGNLCSRFISGVSFIENLFNDIVSHADEDHVKKIAKINERFEELLEDFTLFQGSIQEAIPLLDRLFIDLDGEISRGQRINKKTPKL